MQDGWPCGNFHRALCGLLQSDAGCLLRLRESTGVPCFAPFRRLEVTTKYIQVVPTERVEDFESLPQPPTDSTEPSSRASPWQSITLKPTGALVVWAETALQLLDRHPGKQLLIRGNAHDVRLMVMNLDDNAARKVEAGFRSRMTG